VTWLTLFPSDAGTCAGSDPRNTEYAIKVERPGRVDVLYRRLLVLGSVFCREPEDTWMYEPMRFACVDDPFGVWVEIDGGRALFHSQELFVEKQYQPNTY